MSDNPLINIGELSKPATVLIEKISDAIGGVFKPYQIKRIAKAEAEASLIRTKAEIEISQITQRAMHRFIEEETKKQNNIEEITQKAIPKLSDNSKPENIENDWISNFFDKCRLISDQEMQDLWASILSEEANHPNSISKRTINFLSTMDKIDAQRFTLLCKFCWITDMIFPIILNPENDIYNKNGIGFGVLKHLESIGLISYGDKEGFNISNNSNKFVAHYFGKTVLITLPQNYTGLYIGLVFLTRVGQDLARICNPTPENDFYDYIINHWEKNGFEIKEISIDQ